MFVFGKKNVRGVNPGGNTYSPGPLYDPGAQREIYIPLTTLPLESLIARAVQCGPAPNPLQPAPVFIPQPLGIVTGLQSALGDISFTGLVEEVD